MNACAPCRLCVLGGSSPFTLGLIDSLSAAASILRPLNCVLFGQNTNRLQLIANYAAHALSRYGWRIEVERDLRKALKDANLVLHQIRYGGMERRTECDSLCVSLGYVADETLGPAALLNALLCRDDWLRMADELRKGAPDATILNLTNPLSVTTAVLHQHGIDKCVGLCELPRVTARTAAAVLEMDEAELAWDYTGLNHRGFIHRLRDSTGRDLLSSLQRKLEVLPTQDWRHQTLMPSFIQSLRAIPTKYFRLLHSSSDATPGPDRGTVLTQLSREIVAELTANPRVSPPSLRQRDLAWYPDAVVPVMSAIVNGTPSRVVVNLMSETGVVIEQFAEISAGDMVAEPRVVAHDAVQTWVDRFSAHELALLDALRSPSLARVATAVARDPAINPSDATRVADGIWRTRQQRRSSKGTSPCAR